MLRIGDDVKRQLVDALRGLTGAERAETVRAYATTYGISKQAISAITRKAGLRASATRQDRGRSSLSRDEALKVATLLKISRRMDGRIPMTVKQAERLLRRTEQITADVGYGTICRELRRHGMSKADLKRPKPYRSRATAHPNAEWQIDFTACHQWYFDDGGIFRERDVMTALHKNHPAEFRQIRRHLWRIALVDHYSGAFFFQYVYASGETAQDAIEFLIAAMQPKAHAAYIFHGIPDLVLADKGSFAKAQSAKAFCRAFKIDLRTHMPGNPQAKGSVEELHGFLEEFDAGLRLKPPRNEDELNRRAFDHCVEVNCLRPFREAIDPRGRTRMQWWSEIQPEQLFVPPTPEACRAIIRAGRQPRQVGHNGRVKYERRFYLVPDTNAWGGWVEVAYDPRAYPEVEVTWKDQTDGHALAVWRLKPLQVLGGFLEDSVRPGEIRKPAATITQRAIGEMEQVAQGWGITWKGTGDKRIAVGPKAETPTPTWFEGVGDAADKLVTRPTPGTLRAPTDPAAERRVTVMGLLGELAESLGRPLTRAENARIRAAWPEGCRMSDIDEVLNQLTGGDQPRPYAEEERDGTRAVG